jgi:hypothetical protein
VREGIMRIIMTPFSSLSGLWLGRRATYQDDDVVKKKRRVRRCWMKILSCGLCPLDD